jgi:riboflavin synthase
VENKFLETELKLGQSIAHDGACMTLTDITTAYYEFFMMQESLDVTSFGTKNSGDRVNVERCLRLGDRIDGHIVSGHIDTV